MEFYLVLMEKEGKRVGVKRCKVKNIYIYIKNLMGKK